MVHETLPQKEVAVIGLHTVFEHHAAMTPVSLKAFIREYHITFPLGVDKPGEAPRPETMERFGLRGTPAMLLMDRKGDLGGFFGYEMAARHGHIPRIFAPSVPDARQIEVPAGYAIPPPQKKCTRVGQTIFRSAVLSAASCSRSIPYPTRKHAHIAKMDSGAVDRSS